MTDYADLVKRMRADMTGIGCNWLPLMREAADTIERLSAQVVDADRQAARLLDRATKAERERDEARAAFDNLAIESKTLHYFNRAEAAEAEVVKLREALKLIAGATLHPVHSDADLQFNVLVTAARAALEAKHD